MQKQSVNKITLGKYLMVVLILLCFPGNGQTKPLSVNFWADTLITVPLGGNAWSTLKDTSGGMITNDGVVKWSSKQTGYNVYIRFAKTGNIKVWVNCSVPQGSSKIVVTSNITTKELTLTGIGRQDHYLGEWAVTDTGYMVFKIKGMTKTGQVYADINSLKFQGTAIDQKTSYVKNNEGAFFHWGRRGPSVHLGYLLPDSVKAEWFYNEVTVPKGNDVIGSYFMADGFGEGYFGMQVNSPTERHILFSVWSPFKTDDPKQIPDDQKIIMLKKGANVHTGEFGNEGSGGQSYLLYNWRAGNTYKFLMHAKPGPENRTVYTAYFYAPELNRWQLIASFSRPQTQTYLKHLHSFLENFEPEQGEITRQVEFNNEWVINDKGKWIELNKAKFTGDNTAIQRYRMDYAGGLEGDSFYLKNCGFFNNYTSRDTVFERPLNNIPPVIDFSILP